MTTISTTKKPCKHRKTWIIMAGWAEWCYVCGAWRHMRANQATNTSTPAGPWHRPSGDPKVNPWKEGKV